ncbi:MAG: VWA domain-containing protein [Myxococcota bacterium]|nr:VWA domain-containing protein [Myxococcota bacterium]
MTFVTTFALAAALLVVAPYLAHRLRRRRAEDEPFAPTRLVPPAPPQARRRSHMEDRALFATRAAAVVTLAILGATPFVRCSRLSLQRSTGASVAMAIIVDDSMSMRAGARGGRSRLERARMGAVELLASARDGDALAVVLAGAPPRVALAATTDLGAARRAIDAISETDLGTDLDGAVALAQGLISSVPQSDRRIIVLSDLADGRPDAAPLGASSAVPIWIALPELRAEGFDCALMRADRAGVRVRIQVVCGPGGSPAGREVVVEDAAGNTLGHAVSPAGPNVEVTVLLPSENAEPVRARLSGIDAVSSDDMAPVVLEAQRGAIAVVADAADETVVTGGAPIAEQALTAMKLDIDVHPIPAFPDRAEDLTGVLGVLLDDPPGFTPEQRRALAAYLESGGVVLLALGSHAATAPLGASLEPALGHAVAWKETMSAGVDPASVIGELAESASSMLDLGAPRRAVLAQEDIAALEPLAKWADGAPLVARRPVGRGDVWIVTLPVSIDASDFALRPAFLAVLGAWAREAREHATAKRSDVGSTWTFAGAGSVDAQGPAGPIGTARDERGVRVVPPLAGLYRLTVDGKTEVRVATPVARELDLRPRQAASRAAGMGVGERRGSVDISGQVALVLLTLVALELVLRLWRRQTSTP